MATQRTRGVEPRPFSVLGISEQEERIYRWLLVHPRASAEEAAHALALSPGKAQHLLDAIEAKGLTTHSPERPRRYIPASPDMAMEALILQRQNDLQRVRSAARELQKEMETVQPRDKREQMVELITSREAGRQTYDHMYQTAQREVVAMMRPPILISRFDVPSEQEQHHQREAQARGVHYRSVVDMDFLALPGAMNGVRNDMEAGEEVRVISDLPFKMLIFDRRVAFIPLNLQQSDSPSLLVRSSALLDALYALFEILWERAAPISFTHIGMLEVGDSGSRLPKEAEDLISLMAAGLNDKKVAHELGISASTLTRRISGIMKTFNARNRFQLGRHTDRRLYDRDSK